MSTTSERENAILADMTVPAEVSKPLEDTFDAAFNAYWAKNGVKAHEEKLAAVVKPFQASLHSGMLTTAQIAYKLSGGNALEALKLFRAACYHTEMRAKDKAKAKGIEETSMVQILPSWAPTKTVIVKFLERKGDLFESETVDGKVQPRFTSIERVRRANQERGAQGPRTAAGAPQVFKKGTPKLTAVMQALSNELAQCDADLQDDAAVILDRALAEIHVLRLEYAKPDATESEVESEAGEAQQVPAAVIQKAKKERLARGGSRA